MLAKKYRLKKSDVLETLKKGEKKEGYFLKMIYLKKEIPYPLFTVVVSKKNLKQAVKRNKIKRWIKTAIYQNLAYFPSGFYLFFLEKIKGNLNFKKIFFEIKKFLAKI